MRKLMILLLLVLPLAGMVGCGTDRVVTPIYTGPPQDFGLTAVLDKAADPGSRVFISGSIISPTKTDSLVLFGSVGADGRTITGNFMKNVTPNDSNFFLVLWVERPDLVLERKMVPMKVGGVELTAIKSNEFGVWWELGIGWNESGPTVLTLRDDRSRLVEVPVVYVGNTAMGETVAQATPVRCKSTWSGIALPTAPWGTHMVTPMTHYQWTIQVLKPAPGSDPTTLYFRLEDAQRQRLYGCLLGGNYGLEMKNLKNLGTVERPWLVFEVRYSSAGIPTNPRDRDERGGIINVTPGN